MLIRSSVDAGVSVQVRPVPPNFTWEKVMETNEKGFLLCPKCRKKTNVKVLPETVMLNYVLYCKHCKKEIIINHNPDSAKCQS